MSTLRFQALREASTRKPFQFEETEKKSVIFGSNVFNSKFQFPNSKILNSKLQIANSKFQIPNTKFQIPNCKYQIPKS
jgi:hypothetical protein